MSSSQNILHATLDASGYVHAHSCYNTQVNLVPIPVSDPEYRIIAQKFREGWKHPEKPTIPTIKNIFYVAYSQEGLKHLGQFSEYCNKVGNVQLFFHGTKRACSIAENQNALVCCKRDDCNLCSILRGSYNMERAKGKRMFGPGIYSTLVSSKADGYCGNVGNYLRSKVMIVNHVALGNSKIMHKADHDMMHAPALYNSVTAATIPEGGKVIYHEAVIYREDAICANAIIVYD